MQTSGSAWMASPCMQCTMTGRFSANANTRSARAIARIDHPALNIDPNAKPDDDDKAGADDKPAAGKSDAADKPAGKAADDK